MSDWRKIENEAGYPCYIDDKSGKQDSNHPQFRSIMEALKEYDCIKYGVYRVAFKLHHLQRQYKAPPINISSGVFTRHQLSMSESSLSLEPAELEAVLADIYFAAEKEGVFSGDIDLVVDLIINLLLNVYDSERKEPVRVLAAKTVLIILSESPLLDKWCALANCAADHNGCVSSKRFTNLLNHVTKLFGYLDGKECGTVQKDVDACFDHNAGMLGLNSRTVAEWAIEHSETAKPLAVLTRIQESRMDFVANGNCAACDQAIVQMLIFKCSKCKETYFCEKCYLYDKISSKPSGHKNTHVVLEIIDKEPKPSDCLRFINSVRKFIFCSKSKSTKPKKKAVSNQANISTKKKVKSGKPSIFTSTVGKASGNAVNNPASVLQDIIMQLESQNKILKDLSEQLTQASVETDAEMKHKVELHYSQISTQINRLKTLKENLSSSPSAPTSNTTNKINHMQAFELFSPIQAIEETKPSKITDNMKSQPRVLSLDSGNFSVGSKQTDNLMTLSGDAFKPVVNNTTDSISTVSMNDISTWYNDPESSEPHKKPDSTQTHIDQLTKSLCVSQEKFDADLRSVASSNDKMRELNADLDCVLDRLQQILSTNFSVDESCFDNTQLRETANEMEGLLGTLIRGVEQRATLTAGREQV